jgi:predicted transcriptional regulator
MKTFTTKKEIAIALRKRGVTHPTIVKLLKVRKTTISTWLKGIEVPKWYPNMIKNKRIAPILKMTGEESWQEKTKEIGLHQRKRIPIKVGSKKYLTCNKCKQTLPLVNFAKRGKTGRWTQWCNSCAALYQSDATDEVIRLLGGKCECGCAIKELLQIHHRNFDGKYDRKYKSHYTILREIRDMPKEKRDKKYKLVCKICHDVEHLTKKYPFIKYQVKCEIMQDKLL